MSTPRRNALGRGLGALIPSPPPPVAYERFETDAPPATGAPHELPIDEIPPNPDQPRRRFDEQELARLAESIGRHGVLQPVVVRAREGGYELVVGERRWRAARLAGRRTLPVVVKDVAAPDLLELALVENVQRHDLNPIELAFAFRTLVDGGATQEQVGERLGLDRSTVANHLRMLELPRELQADVEEGTISAGHAKALLAVPSPERRRHLRDRIVGESLSVRAAEGLARELAGPAPERRKSPQRPVADPDLAYLIDRLREALQTKVRIAGTAQRGKIELEYYSGEELNRIARAILEGGR
jgi:ParB family transcriptional regulator, chromosome partitioning protein